MWNILKLKYREFQTMLNSSTY